MNAVVRLEDSHPELAEFIQDIALGKNPYDTLKIKNGRFFRKQDIRTIKKIGRNEPCPCLSGKKYKKCCGR